MEAKARELKVREPLHYMFPNSKGPSKTDAEAWSALDLGDRLLIDTHESSEDDLHLAMDAFEKNASLSSWGIINCETNCGGHAVNRMLSEADDLNRYFRDPSPRLRGRAASFCLERSGFSEGGYNDQGLSFFLPNM